MSTLIHSFFYSKVAPDKSPFKKNGFHMLAYPLEHLIKKELLELESHIHYGGGVIDKKIIFYHSIRSQISLVIIRLQSVEGAKDEFGRTGVFFAHGFIFPPEIYLQIKQPSELFGFVDQFTLSGPDKLFDSSQYDSISGNFLPFIWDDFIKDQKVYPGSKEIIPNENEIDRKILVLLYKIAIEKVENYSIVFKGEPNDISTFLSHHFYYLPNGYLKNTGWDSGFDNGKIFFFPLKIVGYSQSIPTTGEPIVYDLDSKNFQSSPTLEKSISPESYYDRWISKIALGEIVSLNPQKILNAVYNLSLFFENKCENPGRNECIPYSFFEINGGLIRVYFKEKTHNIIPTEWAEIITQNIAVSDLVNMILDKYPIGIIVDNLALSIIKAEIPLSSFKNQQIPGKFLKEGGRLIQLISKALANNILNPIDMEGLTIDERKMVYEYFLKTYDKYKVDFWNCITTESEDNALQMQEMWKYLYETFNQLELQQRIKSKIKEEWNPIALILVTEMIRNKKIYLIGRLTDSELASIFEDFILSYDKKPEYTSTLYKWIKDKKEIFEISSVLKAWVHPEDTAPDDEIKKIITTKNHKIPFLEALMTVHSEKSSIFEEKFGYTFLEIKMVKQTTSKSFFRMIIEKIKGVF